MMPLYNIIILRKNIVNISFLDGFLVRKKEKNTKKNIKKLKMHINK